MLQISCSASPSDVRSVRLENGRRTARQALLALRDLAILAVLVGVFCGARWFAGPGLFGGMGWPCAAGFAGAGAWIRSAAVSAFNSIPVL